MQLERGRAAKLLALVNLIKMYYDKPDSAIILYTAGDTSSRGRKGKLNN
jgi:hypothetical protein